MKIPDRWWTAPAQAESGRTVIVTGRDRLDPIRDKGTYSSRIEITWKYDAKPDGMPSDEDAELMGEATDAMKAAFDADPVAVMTGIYTGDGERDWIFYTRNLRVFGFVLNKALSELPTIPIVIEAYSDPEWEEYDNMREQSYIPPDEDEK